MIVTCPACATRYVVDPAALGANGRTVRCARCADTWFQAPPPGAAPVALPVAVAVVTTPPPAADGSPAVPSEVMPSFIGSSSRPETPKLPALRKPPRRIGLVPLGWTALALFVVAIVAGTYFLRGRIVEDWPPAQRLYNLIGLSTPGIGDWLKVHDVQSAYQTEDGQLRMIVSGQIDNLSSAPRIVPKLHVDLVDAQGEIVESWVFQAGGEPLQPGQTVPFTTSNPAPTTEVALVKVTFADD
jgi:predicted Zn finger-like uncharacterized protein